MSQGNKSIPEGWEESNLVDKLESLIDYRGKTPKKSDNGILTLSAKSVKMGRIEYSQAYHISPEEYKKFMVRGFPKIGDILMTTEAPLGCIAKLDRDDVGIAQRLLTLRGKKDILDNNYLMYYLTSTKGQHELHSRASGSTVQGIKRSEFIKVNILLPNYSEQKAIAKVLTAFDDKIENLREQNEILEQIAQTIFIEWFGKYKIGDDLPEGWRVGTFGGIIEFINGYAFKSKELSKEPMDNAYKVFKMGDIKKGGGFKPDKTKGYFPKSSSQKLKKYILKSGDLLMSMTDMKDAISLLGHTALMIFDDEYIVNQRVGLIRAKNELDIEYPYLYLLTNNNDFIANIRAGANSGVQVNLSTQGIKDTELIIADKETNKLFNDIAKPLFEKRKANSLMMNELKKTRDTLLPKLMSGQLRVKNVETTQLAEK